MTTPGHGEATPSRVDRTIRHYTLGEVFSPAAPIDDLKLFAGRSHQRTQVIDAILQRGRHAVLYGDRGVGKTSLASTLQAFLERTGKEAVAARVNCDEADTFPTLWRKVFREFRYVEERRQVGFSANAHQVIRSWDEGMRDRTVTPDTVREVLATVGETCFLIVIIDEFDRVADRVGGLFSDTIKTLSDHSVPVTIVVVGVADTVEALISKHESIERALAQIRVTRMSEAELNEIIDLGLREAGMTIAPDARHRIVALSQGLPHYTHLVTLHSARAANADQRDEIEVNDVQDGIRTAVQNAQESIANTHHKAVRSAQKDSLHRQAALACALARPDNRGWFTASAVKAPMRAVTGKPYEIANFTRHLTDFCSPVRGPILKREGTQRNYHFRFVNPLMQPFILMDGLSRELIDDVKLRSLAESEA